MREVTLAATNIKEYPNKPMTGYFLGTRTVDTQFGDSQIHDFQLENGKRVSIYGFTSLNGKLALIEPGLLCEITYTGTENVKTKYGKKDVHQCKVLVDDNKKIALTRLPKFDNAQDTKEDLDDLPF